MPQTTNRARAAILGASGYTGAELIRLLARHPHIEIRTLTADRRAGEPFGAVFPHLAALGLPDLVRIQDVDFAAHDIVFCCLPHGTTQETVAALPEHLKVVDLSADFRLADVETYAEWYGHAHLAPELQKSAVYGLTELKRREVAAARLVANPGCYPTGAQLPLAPLLAEGAISARNIVIDAKSGVTGAGRGLREDTLFPEVQDGIHAYGIGRHRHAPEIEQGLGEAAGAPVTVTFTPHLAPMNRASSRPSMSNWPRGRRPTACASASPGAMRTSRSCMCCPPARRRPGMCAGANRCDIGVAADRVPGRAILVSAIDNLVKGASGQAVQNMNAMLGVAETTALELEALYP